MDVKVLLVNIKKENTELMQLIMQMIKIKHLLKHSN